MTAIAGLVDDDGRVWIGGDSVSTSNTQTRETLQSAGCAKAVDGVESGGDFLVGVAGGLYSVESDYQVGIPACGYEAVGCGDQLVMGSLHATARRGFHPRYRIRLALEAATAFSVGVGPPYVIKSVAL